MAFDEWAKHMRRSKSEIYLHLVWTTWHREPLLQPILERAIHRCIVAEAEKLGCTVLAIGGAEDHVPLAVKTPTKLCASDLAKQIKGVSSTLARRLRQPEPFGWQDGYGVFSFGRRDIGGVIAYIRNQKEHHSSSSTEAEWEQTFEEILEQ